QFQLNRVYLSYFFFPLKKRNSNNRITQTTGDISNVLNIINSDTIIARNSPQENNVKVDMLVAPFYFYFLYRFIE
ncbi:hypothetical protein, partial [Bacillus vallismortis]|uniref:hypothetical protein n=1 Tax=Bacillus vallismortis TaxID=72361 RepID=UPI00228211BF